MVIITSYGWTYHKRNDDKEAEVKSARSHCVSLLENAGEYDKMAAKSATFARNFIPVLGIYFYIFPKDIITIHLVFHLKPYFITVMSEGYLTLTPILCPMCPQSTHTQFWFQMTISHFFCSVVVQLGSLF